MYRHVHVFDGNEHTGFRARIVSSSRGRGLHVIRLDTSERTFVARETWKTLWTLVAESPTHPPKDYIKQSKNTYAYVDTSKQHAVVIVANVRDICAADVVFAKHTKKDPRSSSFAVYPLQGTSVKGYLSYCERRKKERK